MRGVAALIVVIYHAVGVAPMSAPAGWEYWLPTLVSWGVHFGYAGVYLFFVISGFCIHLFWARKRVSGVATPVIEFSSFWRRRLRRLYPAYLAALILYLVHNAFQSPFQLTGAYVWDVSLHLLMLHNLDFSTTYSINAAFWTLAIEEQLYLAYFLLLFLRIRYGWRRTLAVCLGARVGWLLLCRVLYYSAGIAIPVSEAAATNWFIWALGALSVEAALGLVELPAWTKKAWVGGLALMCAMGLAEGLPLLENQVWLHDAGWLLMHPFWGLGFFILVNSAVGREQAHQRKRARMPRFIIVAATLGLFSYSLYLTHLFVLMKWYWFGFTRFHILTISLVIMVPLSVIFAWLFYRLFERPFMTLPPPHTFDAPEDERRTQSQQQMTEPVNDAVSV